MHGADILPVVIDLKTLRDQPDAVRASQRARGEDESLVDAVLAADERRREAIGAFESARAEQKAASKELGPLMGRLKKAEKAGEDVMGPIVGSVPGAADPQSEQVTGLPFLEIRIDKGEIALGPRTAVIADEAHSSQTGEAAAKLKEMLAEAAKAVKGAKDETKELKQLANKEASVAGSKRSRGSK